MISNYKKAPASGGLCPQTTCRGFAHGPPLDPRGANPKHATVLTSKCE